MTNEPEIFAAIIHSEISKVLWHSLFVYVVNSVFMPAVLALETLFSKTALHS